MSIFYQPEISNGVHILDVEESRHCVKVLRKKVGDIIQIIDGKGACYSARIEENNPKKCSFSIIEVKSEPDKKFYIHIAIAPTKNMDRLEWFDEEAVEVGVDKISLLKCHNSERSVVNTERLVKKAVSATKQSLRYAIPTITPIIGFTDFLKQVSEDELYIAYVDRLNQTELFKTASPERNYCVLIGPEGDFTSIELDQAIEYNFKKVSLGRSRLRTETAGLVACHLLNIIQP